MKLKAQPDDFRVEERLNLRLRRRGPHSVYRLEKRYWNTLDVIRELEHKHRLRNIGRAGLKDRYSHSVQYLSCPGSGPRTISASNYRLSLVGRSDEPVSHAALLGNRFTITVRALQETEAERILAGLPKVSRYGIPNYYDEQRLGSARHAQGFIARRLIAGHYNGALRLYAATPSPADDSRTRRRKQLTAENWGNWRECLRHVSDEARPAFEHLARRPRDLKAAVRLLPRSLLELFLNAFQAYLWNQTAAQLIDELGVAAHHVPYSHGRFLFYDTLRPDALRYLKKLVIPAPAPAAEFASDRVARIAGEILAREELDLAGLRLRLRLKGLFFKPWNRNAIVIPKACTASRPKPDDRYPDRLKLKVGFFLPAGAYATMVIKRLALG